MSKRQFLYLQDGQTVSERERFRSLLSKDSAAVLSVCRSSLKDFLEMKEEIENSVSRITDRLFCSIRELIELSRSSAEQIPESFGFFVSNEERQVALQCAVHFWECLTQIEGKVGFDLLSLGGQGTKIRLCHGAILSTEKDLLSAIGAGDDFPDVKKECQNLLLRLQAGKAALEGTRGDASELRTIAFQLSQRLNRALKEVLKHADIQNDGSSCSPARVRVLMGELQHEGEELFRTMETRFCINLMRHKKELKNKTEQRRSP